MVTTQPIRVPARLVGYIAGHAYWNDNEDADPDRAATIAALRSGTAHADGGITVGGTDAVLSVLGEEAKYLLNATYGGDNSSDDRADRSAARRFLARRK